MDGRWDIVTTSLQDLFNSNESVPFDKKFNLDVDTLEDDELIDYKDKITEHKQNVETGRRFLQTAIDNVNIMISNKNTVPEAKSKKKDDKSGRSYHTSVYNPSEPVVIRSEVAYNLRSRGGEPEWIQCEVTRILGDGTRFEIRDPEPDENNNPGQTFKATWKDVILLPSRADAPELIAYPYGTKVLARYPETTTFYPAEVIGTKRDGRCRLRFDGEEEVGKETEVERRLVLPYPER